MYRLIDVVQFHERIEKQLRKNLPLPISTYTFVVLGEQDMFLFAALCEEFDVSMRELKQMDFETPLGEESCTALDTYKRMLGFIHFFDDDSLG